MTGWGSIRSIPIGGLVVVGFLDERRIVVGSHSGLGVFDAREGTRLDRVADLDDDYAWFREAPPVAAYTDRHGEHLVEVAGLWVALCRLHGRRLDLPKRDRWCRAIRT